MCVWAVGKLWKVEMAAFWLGRGRASESKKRKEMRRGRNVWTDMKSGDQVDRLQDPKGRLLRVQHSTFGSWGSGENRDHVTQMRFFEIFGRRMECFWKSEDMDSRGRPGGTPSNWNEEQRSSGGGDIQGRRYESVVRWKNRARLLYWTRAHPCASHTELEVWFTPFELSTIPNDNFNYFPKSPLSFNPFDLSPCTVGLEELETYHVESIE